MNDVATLRFSITPTSELNFFIIIIVIILLRLLNSMYRKRRKYCNTFFQMEMSSGGLGLDAQHGALLG